MKNILCLLLCVIGLNACVKDISPLSSGIVIYDYTQAHPSNITEVEQVLPSRILSADQLQALN